MRSLRAIFFDIDDTLYSTSDFAARARSNSVQAMIAAGLQIDEEACLAELMEVIDEFSSNYEHHFDKLLHRLPQSCYQGINPAALVATAMVAYHETKFRHLTAFEDAVEALKRLSETNLTLGIISAGLTIKQFEKLVRLKLVDFFAPSAIFISEQIGISKPNPKLYQRSCEAVACPPEQAMYIGDNPVSDIDPANATGMVTVLFNRGARHSQECGRTPANFEIHNYWDLLDILKENFAVQLPETGS